MKPLIRLLVLLSLASYPRPAHAQNRCIDNCWFSCSAEPLGSSSKSACVDLCIRHNCSTSVNVWGAIAYSKPDKAFGYSFEHEDEATARRVAMEKCRTRGTACVVQTAFRSACGALAAGGGRVGWGVDRTRQAAEQRALSECAKTGASGCEIQAWACSAPNAAGSSETSAPPSPPPVARTAAWGAIAYSVADMGAGWAQGKADQTTAEREAMAACRQRGKACVLRASFNKQCGALAADGTFEGWGTSTDARQAQQEAMNGCRKAGGARCALRIMFCSM
jgi:hypothetical protein